MLNSFIDEIISLLSEKGGMLQALSPECIPASSICSIMPAIIVFPSTSRKISISTSLGGIFASSGIFFIVSNFGVWTTSAMYPKNISGLVMCYAAGIPFLNNTIISDALFTTVLFGMYYLLQKEFSPLRLKHINYS